MRGGFFMELNFFYLTCFLFKIEKKRTYLKVLHAPGTRRAWLFCHEVKASYFFLIAFTSWQKAEAIAEPTANVLRHI